MASLLVKNTADWMAALRDNISKYALWDIAIPGTHDSCTSGIDLNNLAGLSPDAKKMVRIHYRANPKSVAAWSKTQGRKILEQLQDGIRYFDFRVCLMNDGMHFCHAVVCEPPGDFSYGINTILIAIRDFLRQHTGEIVILDFQHFFAMDIQAHQSLADTLLRLFGDWMIPSRQTPPNILEMLRENQRVIILYATVDRAGGSGSKQILSNAEYGKLWPRDPHIQSIWANTARIKTLVRFLNNEANNKPDKKFWVWQCQLSYTLPIITPSRSLRVLAGVITNPCMSEWLSTNILNNKPNIIILDWYDETDWFVDVILNYNARL